MPPTRMSRNLRPAPAVPVYNDQPEPVILHKLIPPLTVPYPSPVFSKFTDNAQHPSTTSPHVMSVGRTSPLILSTVSAPSQQEQEAPNPFSKCESIITTSSTSNENRAQQRITTRARSIAIARSQLPPVTARSGLSTSPLPPAIISTPAPVPQELFILPEYIQPASRRVTPITKVDRRHKKNRTVKDRKDYGLAYPSVDLQRSIVEEE